MATRTPSNQHSSNYVTATYFSLFLGVIGVDRFYMRYVGLGILKLITIGGFGIWWLIDLIWIALGNAKTKTGVPLTRNQADTQLVLIGVGIFLLLQIVSAIVGAISYTSSLHSLDNSVRRLTKTIQGAVVETTNSGESKNGEQTIKITFPKE